MLIYVSCISEFVNKQMDCSTEPRYPLDSAPLNICLFVKIWSKVFRPRLRLFLAFVLICADFLIKAVKHCHIEWRVV